MESGKTLSICLLVLLYISNFENVYSKLLGKTNRFNQLQQKDVFMENETNLYDVSERSAGCPLAADIAPCVCTTDDLGLILNCDAVGSEDELATIFHQPFPQKDFLTFTMTNNYNINTLGNILNGVTFEHVIFEGCSNLRGISDQFLVGCFETLRSIYIFDALSLTADSFPFESLQNFTQLEELNLNRNSLGHIPPLRSASLNRVMIIDAALTILEPAALEGLTNGAFYFFDVNRLTNITSGTFPINNYTTSISLFDNGLRYIKPGTFYFTGHASAYSDYPVEYLLQANSLTKLEAGTIRLRNSPTSIILNTNSLVVIEPGTFVHCSLETDKTDLVYDLSNNNLAIIDEDVFGEMMPYVSMFSIAGNPLTCGCDILWIVSNAAYMNVLDTEAACADGTLISAIDVQQLTDMCAPPP